MANIFPAILKFRKLSPFTTFAKVAFVGIILPMLLNIKETHRPYLNNRFTLNLLENNKSGKRLEDRFAERQEKQ